jgi:hypothetical protein
MRMEVHMLYTILSVLLYWLGASVLAGLALGKIMREPSDEPAERYSRTFPPVLGLIHR